MATVSPIRARAAALIAGRDFVTPDDVKRMAPSALRHRISPAPELEIEGVLLTMVDERTNLTQQVIAEVRTHFKDKVFETQVPRSIRLAEAPSFGQPVILYDIRSKGAEAYLQLARELMSHGQMALFAR